MSVFATHKHRETFVLPIEAERDRSLRSHRRRSTFVPVEGRGSRIVAIVAGTAMIGNFAAAISFATGLGK